LSEQDHFFADIPIPISLLSSVSTKLKPESATGFVCELDDAVSSRLQKPENAVKSKALVKLSEMTGGWRRHPCLQQRLPGHHWTSTKADLL